MHRRFATFMDNLSQIGSNLTCNAQFGVLQKCQPCLERGKNRKHFIDPAEFVRMKYAPLVTLVER